MAKCCWALAVCLLTAATAVAQAPRGEGEESRGFGDRGGPGGQRGPGGMFRRANPMFAAIDADGDGAISSQELRKAAAALKKLDADGDGKITMAEAGGGPSGPSGRFGDPSQMVDRIMSGDQNGDGKLTPDEVDPRMRAMLRGADQDGDGAVDRAELEGAMEQMRQRGMGGMRGSPGGGFGGRGGGFDPRQMTQQMMASDRNGDGKLTPDEVDQRMGAMLRGGDQNGDGAIEPAEMEQIVRRMGARMRGEAFGGEQPGRGRFGRGDDESGENGDERGPRSRRGPPEREDE